MENDTKTTQFHSENDQKLIENKDELNPEKLEKELLKDITEKGLNERNQEGIMRLMKVRSMEDFIKFLKELLKALRKKLKSGKKSRGISIGQAEKEDKEIDETFDKAEADVTAVEEAGVPDCMATREILINTLNIIGDAAGDITGKRSISDILGNIDNATQGMTESCFKTNLAPLYKILVDDTGEMKKKGKYSENVRICKSADGNLYVARLDENGKVAKDKDGNFVLQRIDCVLDDYTGLKYPVVSGTKEFTAAEFANVTDITDKIGIPVGQTFTTENWLNVSLAIYENLLGKDSEKYQTLAARINALNTYKMVEKDVRVNGGEDWKYKYSAVGETNMTLEDKVNDFALNCKYDKDKTAIVVELQQGETKQIVGEWTQKGSDVVGTISLPDNELRSSVMEAFHSRAMSAYMNFRGVPESVMPKHLIDKVVEQGKVYHSEYSSDVPHIARVSNSLAESMESPYTVSSTTRGLMFTNKGGSEIEIKLGKDYNVQGITINGVETRSNYKNMQSELPTEARDLLNATVEHMMSENAKAQCAEYIQSRPELNTFFESLDVETRSELENKMAETAVTLYANNGATKLKDSSQAFTCFHKAINSYSGINQQQWNDYNKNNNNYRDRVDMLHPSLQETVYKSTADILANNQSSTQILDIVKYAEDAQKSVVEAAETLPPPVSPIRYNDMIGRACTAVYAIAITGDTPTKQDIDNAINNAVKETELKFAARPVEPPKYGHIEEDKDNSFDENSIELD